MKIILTHEQADFDAIASLLAASLIEEGSLPVLPRKTNRNVHSFLTLYRDELPFIDSRDIPTGEIGQITLVDTQSLVTLKGTTKDTRVIVIDHHDKKENLDPSWSMRLEKVGAVTTILSEIIQDQNISLTPTQATLLLLGIYEDTGSLSYASTTARDIRCAAYLIEQGANLRIAVGYLNPPLSIEQKSVYDRLITNAKTFTYHGLKLIVSSTEAIGVMEEISSIAHKMRDLLEPDGLVVIVATEEGYRMVLRSTSDQVNVSLLAAHFGGGGHERAAAALVIRPPGIGYDKDTEKLEQIQQELLNILPSIIHPPITVKQIMSHRPRLIPPSISAEEARLLMQKYGYEGFPVVDQGEVIGLLTRRAVDRSLAHKLNLSASSLMEAGNVTIAPGDSIDDLQEVMTETGWGQIPVVDPGNREIIGIVTRTDLIKVLATPTLHKKRQHLAFLLETGLPQERLLLLKAVAEKASDLHMAAYIVGGIVRDLILHRPGSDFDIVVEGDAIALAKALSEKYGGRLVSHSRFGTAKWYLDRTSKELAKLIPPLQDNPLNHEDFPDSLDLITARTEFYDRPTALPTVERSSIKLDLHRRDFTINTMAVRLDGRHFGDLLDHWGGYNDLKNGLIRVLHSLSFIDDPTRALRAVRFEQRFNFSIEPRTQHLLFEAVDQLRSITGERLRHEIDLILSEEKAGQMFERMQGLGILSNIHPALTWDVNQTSAMNTLLKEQAPETWNMRGILWGYPLHRVLGYCFWLMKLTEKDLDEVSSRLRIPANIHKIISQAHQLQTTIHSLPGNDPSVITNILDGFNPAAILCVSTFSGSAAEKAIINKYMTNWRNIHPSIDGRYLAKIGLPPGPGYKVILEKLRGAWLDGKIDSLEKEKEVLKELISIYSKIKDDYPASNSKHQ